MQLSSYNIRVYGILINQRNELLLSKEHRYGKKFTKLPGGGHELGEGLMDGLKREFYEELGISIKVESHFYTTDNFQISALDENQQLISIYYNVSSQEENLILDNMQAIDLDGNVEHNFIWKALNELTPNDVTYPIDKLVIQMLKNNLN